MKKFLFISDFDGTISKEDFYKMMSDKYVPSGNEMYSSWQNGEILDIDYLAHIFNNINQPKEIIDKEAKDIPIDESLADFINFVESSGGKFVILSAGATYYIEKVLEKRNINVDVYSNKSEYKDNGIYYTISKDDEFYHERYGIEKAKVVEHLKSKDKYDFVCYAGDSMPDYAPSILCDYIFSKAKLHEELTKNNIDNIKFTSFEKEVKSKLEELLNEK